MSHEGWHRSFDRARIKYTRRVYMGATSGRSALVSHCPDALYIHTYADEPEKCIGARAMTIYRASRDKNMNSIGL